MYQTSFTQVESKFHVHFTQLIYPKDHLYMYTKESS